MTTAQELDARYGRTARRRLPWVVFITVVVIGVAAFGWMIVADQMRTVDVDDLGFSVVDEHTIEVRFGVTTRTDDDLVCAVEALDEEYGVVGFSIVEVAGDTAPGQTVTERVRTVGEATTGLVNSCWVA